MGMKTGKRAASTMAHWHLLEVAGAKDKKMYKLCFFFYSISTCSFFPIFFWDTISNLDFQHIWFQHFQLGWLTN